MTTLEKRCRALVRKWRETSKWVNGRWTESSDMKFCAFQLESILKPRKKKGKK